MYHSGFQAARLRANFGLNKDQLVKEYAAVIGVGVQDTVAFFGEAVRYVYAHVLKDMRPPWLEHSLPQGVSLLLCLPLQLCPKFGIKPTE